jgi:uroporphyrin-3 C-methyltransferase
MSSEPQVPSPGDAEPSPVATPVAAGPEPVGTVTAQAPVAAASRRQVLALGLVAALALLLSVLLWDRQARLQDQLARQSADVGASAAEARALARQAQEQQRELAARQAVMEARLGEVALQRSQLDELMQSLSRSRDENLVVDIESAIRLAQQQAQLTGSVEPLLAALKTAEQRVQRVPQARLAPLQRALARDTARIKAAPLSDTPTLLARLDELVGLVDELPLANAVASGSAPAREAATPAAQADMGSRWRQALQLAWDELRGLVRVSRIDQPEAVLLAPEQSFFLRENLKLVLLNARLGLLARQPEAARADLRKAAAALNKYFDGNSRRTRAAASLLQQTLEQMKTLELPRVDDTLAALATAAAGR